MAQSKAEDNKPLAQARGHFILPPYEKDDPMTTHALMFDRLAAAAAIVRVGQTEVMPRFRNLAASAIQVKSQPGDLVTEADLASEKALTPALQALLPGSVVVGEEATYADNSLLDLIAGDAPVWIIDPIDGTHNYAHGVAMFGMIVALTLGGETVAGWIHDPVTGAMITAERGAGAWLNGQRLSVGTAGRPLASLRLSAPPAVEKVLLPHMAEAIYRRSAAQEYMALVTDQIDVVAFTKMMPWDHAAGVLIHREAGGIEALSDGRPYAPTIHDGTFAMAPDRTTLAAILDRLSG